MSTEAAELVQIPEPGDAPEVTPDTTENQLQDTPKGEEKPEGKESETPETPLPKEETPSPEQAQIQMYQDVISKSKEDPTYEMTDEEAEAFLSVQDKIASGMEDPAKAIAKKKPEPKPEPKGEEEPGKDPAKVDVDSISDEHSDVLISAMKRVGAKDISELDGKIEGLINHMKSSGGKKGSELAALKEREASHISWLNDLKAGKAEAKEFLKKATGIDIDSSTSKKTSVPERGNDTQDEDDYFDEEYLDDKLAKKVTGQEKTIEELRNEIKQLKDKDKSRDEDYSRKSAADGWVDDIVDLVTKNQEGFKLKPAEARALAQQYWSKEGHKNPVHPKFQPVHELLKFAYERSMPDLNSAYIVWQHDRGIHAQSIIKAKREGQQSVQHEPSKNAFISKQQAKMKTNVPNPNISEEDITRMERGDLDAIPDEWMDNQGNLLPDKIPERFHSAAFGKLGKPSRR